MNIKVKLSYCKEVNLKSHHFDILSPMYKDCLYVMSRTIKASYGKKMKLPFYFKKIKECCERCKLILWHLSE